MDFGPQVLLGMVFLAIYVIVSLIVTAIAWFIFYKIELKANPDKVKASTQGFLRSCIVAVVLFSFAFYMVVSGNLVGYASSAAEECKRNPQWQWMVGIPSDGANQGKQRSSNARRISQ